MPRLTVKAIAEMLRLPAYNQTRILHEQKYPKQQPQIFRTPYYQPAIIAFRKYYGSGNQSSVLARARSDAQSIANASRRTQIVRAVDAFENSPLSKRKLTPLDNPRLLASLGTTEIRLSADMRAQEGQSVKIFYYNCRQVAIDPEVAQMTAEIAQWVMTENDLSIDLDQIEIMDLAVGKALRFKKKRVSTIRLLRQNAQIIEALWAAV
jgi:hypothetical protein